MIVVVCGAQMSKTEGMFNIIGHRFSDGPYVPALYIGPTEKQVKSISKDRIDKMLRSTPALWERTEKGQRYGVFEKWIAGVRLGFAWAGSATELSSHPAGLVLVDERDRMASDVSNEGDPLSLARARAKNYSNRKIGVFSTPTIENASPIWSLWETGTMMMWAWRCMGCTDFFVPRLDLLKWPDKATANEAYENAVVICPHCQHVHRNQDKYRLNAGGKFIQHQKMDQSDKPDSHSIWNLYHPTENYVEMRTASFWMSGLASPWASFGEIAKVLVDAYNSGSPETIQAEINTYGGELYRVQGEAPEWTEVMARKRDYQPRVYQPEIQKITMGADVQKYGIFYVIRGWGYNAESWLLEHDYLAGETDHDEVWDRLYDIVRAPIGQMYIERALVDSGYRPGDTYRRPDHAVYTFSRRLPSVIYPTKGQEFLDSPFRFSLLDYSYGGKVIRHGVKLININTDFFKRWIHARVRWPLDKSGGWHLHQQTTEDYCKQIVAEQLVMKASGRMSWKQVARSNHYLDCEVNATCAGLSIGVHKLLPAVLPVESDNSAPPPPVSPVAPRHQRRPLF